MSAHGTATEQSMLYTSSVLRAGSLKMCQGVASVQCKMAMQHPSNSVDSRRPLQNQTTTKGEALGSAQWAHTPVGSSMLSS